ncbi:VOC family protein [Spongiivirga sp. MCCC 1A20706]|uniref:VOC family protein n=1 Tax=Spongiivirga sp. MCCC 1A20706 TaxID=3160963 RepID=UPI003977D6B3
MKSILVITFILVSLVARGQSDEKGVERASSKTPIIEKNSTQPSKMPLAFRRTTLIVRDIEKSLALYRDIMGMEVIYDTNLTRPHPKEDRDQIVRLVFLKAIHNFYGVLGLMEYDYGNSNKTTKPIRKEGFTEQNVVLLFNSNNQKAQFEKIKNLKGIDVIKEPTLTEYPSYDGKSKTRVMVAIFYDPDGFLVEFNQLLDDL